MVHQIIKLSHFLWFSSISLNHSFFLCFTGTITTVLLVYIDDIILTGNSIDEIQSITTLLDQTFKIKDFDNLKFFLGLEIARTSQGIYLCQRKYTLDILSDSGMLGSRPHSTPGLFHMVTSYIRDSSTCWLFFFLSKASWPTHLISHQSISTYFQSKNLNSFSLICQDGKKPGIAAERTVIKLK